VINHVKVLKIGTAKRNSKEKLPRRDQSACAAGSRLALSFTKTMALEGQLASQVPHSMHNSVSMMHCVSPSVIALLSQPETQAPQRMHSLVTW
jgi:hypothetical protein